MTQEIDAKLFPVPSHLCYGNQSATNVIPRTWPGVSPSSTEALRGILNENHSRWHVFYDDKGFHNHIAHGVLTLWCLGADASILEAFYKAESALQRPSFASPGLISPENWRDHLGDARYYSAYLQFFKEEFETKNFADLLEEFVFGVNANYVWNAQKQPQMLVRFLASLLHPLIHSGFGVEFGIPGVFLEGLAQTTVHKTEGSALLPPSFFDLESEHDLASRSASAVGISEGKDVHAFTVLARILKDPRLVPTGKYRPLGFFKDVMDEHGDTIAEYVDQWTLEGDLSKKVEELLWMQSLIYGVAGAQKNGPFNSDFFHMHLVTSSLSLPPIFSLLKRSSQVLLLRAYFAHSLAWYIGRGRPSLDIGSFFSDPTTLLPTAPGPHPTPNKDVLPSPTSPYAITPNPWLQVIQSTLVHPDYHLFKLQRTLAEYGAVWGHVEKGHFQGTELKDAEMIDGTLFVRAAGLTAGRLGWVREGEPQFSEGTIWDRRGFFSGLKAKL